MHSNGQKAEKNILWNKSISRYLKHVVLYAFLLVGGGTAGSVLAARLSEEPCISVLVLEAGPKPPLISEVPLLKGSLAGTDVDWNFKIVPQKYSSSAMKDKVNKNYASHF